MWIKEIILDGFKSYATRTVISGFDSQFNAITGLNGSGKSNILDAILFCLGLSKEYDIVIIIFKLYIGLLYLKLRIRKLQELIYKNGTAGVTRAEVSLLIDNSDVENSPSGYQDIKELLVTRQISTDNKSKYFINGHSETQKNYKNMFRSVQLNIDNPHFLVAQGRITKIINLKPGELIGMLEETAGTSLYNEKKREAQRTIEKKEEKLKQVNELIEQEIRPQMDKLVREKNMFLVWRTQEAEKERLRQRVVSYEYYRKYQMLISRQEESLTFAEQIQDFKKQQQYQQCQLDELINDLKAKGDINEIGNKFEQVDKQVKKNQAICVKLERELEGAKKNKERSENDRIKHEQAVKAFQSDIERLSSRAEFIGRNIEQMKQELLEKKDQLSEQQRLSKSSENNEDAKAVIQEETRNTERYLNQYKSTRDQLQDKLRRLNDDISSTKRMAETSERDQSNMATKLNILRNEIERIEKDLEGGIQLENEQAQLKSKKNDCEQIIHELGQRLQQIPGNQMIVNLANLKGWDRSRIFGRVFELFELQDDTYSRAIEYGIGPKITNVIVDDEDTVTEMFRQDIIKMHTYYIPNSRVQQFQASDELIKAADQIAKERGGLAKPAVQLVSYPKELARAMCYVFGNFIVASSMEIAQQVAYHPANRQKFRVVTYDGDIVDPSGTITGGYQSSNSSFLPRAREMVKLKNQIKIEQAKREQLSEQIRLREEDFRFHTQLRQQLQEKRYHYDQLLQKQQKSVNAQAIDLNGMEAERRDLGEQLSSIECKLTEYEEKLSNLVQSQKQSGRSARQVLKEQIDRTVREMDKLKVQLTKQKQDFQAIEVDQENCRQEIQKAQLSISEELQYTSVYNENIRELSQQLSSNQDIQQELQQMRDQLDRDNQQALQSAARLNEQINELNHNLEIVSSERQRAESELSKYKKDIHEFKQDLINLEQKNDFIKKDKNDLMLRELPEYLAYLPTFEYELTRDRLQRLEHDQNRLSKQVNFKVEAMTEQVEREFQGLEEKRKILVNDKSMLTSNMVELDDKKAQTLERCYHEVNKHFGQIFSSLLGGAQARISKIEGKQLEDGLELSVAFNNKWKSSLSELSGGQRSLLALSFILALLKYKPAPFYILDEVDSALDLSHTENIGDNYNLIIILQIGQILSQNFKQSQFILISLKDGMYQNANVLFKVQFLDGVSKIDRFALKDKKKEQQLQQKQQQQLQQQNKQNKQNIF